MLKKFPSKNNEEFANSSETKQNVFESHFTDFSPILENSS